MEIILLVVSFLLPTLLILINVRKRSKTLKNPSSKLPPGPRKLPLIGNIHNLIGSLPHRSFHKLALKHGPVMHLKLGELSTVVISSPEAAKEVMKTHDLNFASRPSILAAEIISYGCQSISFAPYGDYWRQLRKICTLELLSSKRVQSFRSIREEVFSDLVRSIASKQKTVVNLTEKLYSSTYTVISRAVIGNKNLERDTSFLLVIKEIIDLAAGFDVSELYPSVGFFKVVSRAKRRLLKLHKETDRTFDEIIQEHKVANGVMKSVVDDDEKQEDFVDVLLKIQDDGLDLPLSTESIKSVLMDMIAAGSETSATTMDWVMSELLKNPQIMIRAQHEVRKIFDSKGHVDESSTHKLTYLKSIIKETLRLHAPIPLLLPRKCAQTCEINGYEIPADTKVMINAWAINRDSRYWKEPERFNPDRFLHESSSVDYKGSHFEYIPFGAGRRMCPGMSFGLANVELPLAMLLYHFDWDLPENVKREGMDMTEEFGITARRKMDLHVVPVVKMALLYLI